MTKEEMNFWTGVVLMSTGAIWLGWEIVLLIGRGKGQDWDTISMFTKDGAVRLQLLPFFWGVLTAHLFLTVPSNESFYIAPMIWLVWAIPAVIIAGFDIFLWTSDRTQWASWVRLLRTPYFAMFAGLAAGMIGWVQRVKF
jgi:hypothetical protein